MGRFCFSVIRGIVIAENLIVAALASLLIYVSFSALDQDFGMDTLNDNHPKVVHTYISAISAGVGIIIALLSLLGLFGALKKSKSALGMYAAIIFFMISILAITALMTLTIRNTGVVYRDVDKNIVNATIAVYSHTDNNDMKTRVLDYVQRKLACCGINSQSDWKDYGLHKIPKSCCTNHSESNQPMFKYCEQADSKVGCWRAMTDYFHANLSTLRSILYSIIGFGLICCLAAVSMVRTLRKSLEVV